MERIKKIIEKQTRNVPLQLEDATIIAQVFLETVQRIPKVEADKYVALLVQSGMLKLLQVEGCLLDIIRVSDIGVVDVYSPDKMLIKRCFNS